jgi:hypothetical protein
VRAPLSRSGSTTCFGRGLGAELFGNDQVALIQVGRSDVRSGAELRFGKAFEGLQQVISHLELALTARVLERREKFRLK